MITIPLTKGLTATVDDIDADLADLNWCTSWGYAYRRVDPKCVHMHCVIFARVLGRDLVKGEHVDHINQNKSDNTRENLRLASKHQNGCNRGKNRNNKSGFKGVSLDKRRNKWKAEITAHGKQNFLGYFENLADAAVAYDIACVQMHGAFARPNGMC